LLAGVPALSAHSTTRCRWGGLIQIVSPRKL
jgi:hypothetical protein